MEGEGEVPHLPLVPFPPLPDVRLGCRCRLGLRAARRVTAFAAVSVQPTSGPRVSGGGEGRSLIRDVSLMMLCREVPPLSALGAHCTSHFFFLGKRGGRRDAAHSHQLPQLGCLLVTLAQCVPSARWLPPVDSCAGKGFGACAGNHSVMDKFGIP